AKADGLGKWRRRASGFSEALHDLLPISRGGVPEHDPAVEIDPFERTGCRIALCPPRIGQVLLRRVRDGACPQEEGEPARPDDDRFREAKGLRRLEVDDQKTYNDLEPDQPHEHLVEDG